MLCRVMVYYEVWKKVEVSGIIMTVGLTITTAGLTKHM